MKKLLVITCFALLYNLNNASAQKWYAGGTLHQSKISAWKKATNHNKLATCADMVTVFDKSVSLSVLKIRATEVKNCIDEATRGLAQTNNEDVASYAVLCGKLLGY